MNEPQPPDDGPRAWKKFGIVLACAGAFLLYPVDWSDLLGRIFDEIARLGAFDLPGLIIMLGVFVFFLSARKQRKRRREHEYLHQRWTVRPLSWWWFLFVVVCIFFVTAFVLSWLWGQSDFFFNKDLAQFRIEAVRTALTFGAGLVGVVALVLTSRKQWLAEHSQRHTEVDASQQRANEIYATAAEQLASDQTLIRTAGLYALERLAQRNPEQRQMVINLLCAYLRSPYTPPRSSDFSKTPRMRQGLRVPSGRKSKKGLADSPARTTSVNAKRNLPTEDFDEELRVRRTAQYIVARHLRKPSSFQEVDFWPGISIDLSGATLVEWTFEFCAAAEADFSSAAFYGATSFMNSNVDGVCRFHGATFHADATFSEVRFLRGVSFDSVEFLGQSTFGWSERTSVRFNNARFHRFARFDIPDRNSMFFSAEINLTRDQGEKFELPGEWDLAPRENIGPKKSEWRKIIHTTDEGVGY